MTSEWGDYTPSTANGTWTSKCNIAAQARAIAYAADLRPTPNYPMAEGIWKGTWPAQPNYGAPTLNEPDFTGNEYFDDNAIWWSPTTGGDPDKKFLSTVFLNAISPTGLGTVDKDGRGHVLKTTSQDWLSVTYIMKSLADATTGISAGGDAGQTAAQTAYDHIAATFLGCGNKNPVALPTFPNVTWGTTYATKGPTYYTVAGTMQEMSVSYGQQNATSKASTAAEGVVAELLKGPSAAGVTSITDAVLTVYAQSTLRYAANMTLDAHLPGNGMGGSMARVADTTTVDSDVITACGVQMQSFTNAECTDEFGANCGAGTTEQNAASKTAAGSPEGSFDFDFPLCCNIASNAPGGYTVPTSTDGTFVAPPGTGWVDTNWLRAGLDLPDYKTKAETAGDAQDDAANAIGNTYVANAGTTFPTGGVTPSGGTWEWGGLALDTFGIIEQPASQCTNTRANAMGVGNSLALLAPITSTDTVSGTDIDANSFQMDTLSTRLVPYYIGQFGGAAGDNDGCKKMTPVQSDITAHDADPTPNAATNAMLATSTVIDVVGGCGPGMSDFSSNYCTDGGNKDTGADTASVVGNTGLVNPRIASVLGGQAMWNIIAAVFADSADSADVETNTNVNCAENLDMMFWYNAAAVVKNVDGTTFVPATDADKVKGDMPGAVSFPTWFVGIGEDSTGLGSTGFVVPNGFCYAKACLTEFLKSSTGNKGANMGRLVKDPNMANPVTPSSKCGQAQSACADIGGYAAVTGSTSKWDGKEWPVPQMDYVASTTGGCAAAGTCIIGSYTDDGTGDAACTDGAQADCVQATIAAFRGPVF